MSYVKIQTSGLCFCCWKPLVISSSFNRMLMG